LGSIQPGKLADLVVLGGDPAARIEDIGKTEIVFKAGVQYDPAALRKSAEGQVK
jgi:imidazolonepropionase-like amidohydrolase